MRARGNSVSTWAKRKAKQDMRPTQLLNRRMNRLEALMPVLGLLLSVVASGCVARVNPKEAKVAAEVEKLGGEVCVDQNSPDKSVIFVILTDTKVTDVGLEHLKGLTRLQRLDLNGTKVTDAGLEHLSGLIQLEAINLEGTKITDTGLEHLKQLKQLHTLILSNTKVTDAGLKYVKGFTQLGWLKLTGTKVTEWD